MKRTGGEGRRVSRTVQPVQHVHRDDTIVYCSIPLATAVALEEGL